MSALIIILTSLIAGLAVQAIKLITDGIKGNFTWSHLLSDYGGMPSSHAAFVTALATTVGLKEGFNSPTFAICVILAIIIIRDALGLRRHLSRQGEVLNTLAEKFLSPQERTKIPRLKEKLGHSILEVTIGGILGIFLAWVFLRIFEKLFS